jgi:hypothetical protein
MTNQTLREFIGTAFLAVFAYSAHAQDTTINYKGQPPPTAMAPSVTAMGNDICAVPITGAISSTVIGVAGGTAITDANCERIKLARELSNQGLKVAAVAMLCQDNRVWQAMLESGSPCPTMGLIGDAAMREWWLRQPKRFKDIYGEGWNLPTTTTSVSEDKGQ